MTAQGQGRNKACERALLPGEEEDNAEYLRVRDRVGHPFAGADQRCASQRRGPGRLPPPGRPPPCVREQPRCIRRGSPAAHRGRHGRLSVRASLPRPGLVLVLPMADLSRGARVGLRLGWRRPIEAPTEGVDLQSGLRGACQVLRGAPPRRRAGRPPVPVLLRHRGLPAFRWRSWCSRRRHGQCRSRWDAGLTSRSARCATSVVKVILIRGSWSRDTPP